MLQVIKANYILQGLQRAFRIWFLIELGFNSIRPPPIVDAQVAEVARNHPYFHLAADAYWATVRPSFCSWL